jgi:beta-lactamase regulating signal transducer with metallopeptidase domain
MTPAMIHISTGFLIAMADAASRSLVLGGFVAASLAAFRTKNVRVKLFVWKGLLLAALAMPALTLLCPAIRVTVPVPNFPKRGAASGVAAITPAARADVIAEVPAKVPGKFAAISPRVRTKARASQASPIVVQSSLPVAPPSLPVARREIPWVAIALSIYLVIASALLARVLVGVGFGDRLVRSATPIEDARALQLLSAASRAAGLRSAPRLAESEMLSVPIMVGVLKPTVLLPADWRVWEEQELTAVLLHEISHVARQDALLQRLALIHRAVFWFSPLGWWLERHLAELSEQASDEAALAGGVDRTRYAEALLGFFANLEAVPERVWWQGVSMAKAGQAEKRVDRILAWRGAMSNQWKKSLVVALVIVAAPVVALTAAVRPAAYDIQDPPTPAAPPAPAAPVVSLGLIADPPQAPAAPAEPQTAPLTAPALPAKPQEPEPDLGVVVPPQPPIPALRFDVPAINVDIPSVHLSVPPVHVQVPQMHIETRMLPAMPQQDAAVESPITFSMSGDWNYYPGGHDGYFVGRYNDWGPRFAIVAKDSDELTMSGDRDDAEHARALKKKIPGDFIWFERDEKSYIISDAATVDRAKQLWQPNEDLEKQQKELAKQQEELAKQAEDARQKVEDTKIKVPDLSAEMQKVEEAMKQLSANGGTMNEIGDLQRQIGELQRQIGEAEASAGRQQGAWGREQGDWGRKMGEIGRQQGQIGRKQAEDAREASRQMQQLLDDAIAHGLAKPE